MKWKIIKQLQLQSVGNILISISNCFGAFGYNNNSNNNATTKEKWKMRKNVENET